MSTNGYLRRLKGMFAERRRKLSFLRELVGVGALLAMIMAVLGYIGEPEERPYASPAQPSIAAVDEQTDETLTAAKGTRRGSTFVDDSPIVGIDPIADPSIFDRMDAYEKYDKVIAYLPGGELPASEELLLQPVPSQKQHIVIDKVGHTITVFEGGELIRQYGVAVGKNPGNKVREGDMRTPEGTFTVTHVHDASSWVHDFGDGAGVIAGAYGPIFIRLNTYPWSGIGIHGTHDPNSIGTNATEGCVRMRNEEIIELAEMVDSDTTVTILPN